MGPTVSQWWIWTGMREYKRQGNHRIIIVAEAVLEVILYITKY